LTGRPAVDAAERVEILRRIAFEEPPPPRKLVRAIPAELETVALKCLAKNPNERYATAAELAVDLRRWLGDKAIKAKPPTARQRLVKWVRRHRAAVWAAAACLLVTLVVVAGSLGWVARDRQARQREAENSVRAALEEAAPGLRDSNPYDPALI